MPVQYCHYCNRYIDIDVEAEHFDCADDYECIYEEANNQELTEFDFKHN